LNKVLEPAKTRICFRKGKNKPETRKRVFKKSEASICGINLRKIFDTSDFLSGFLREFESSPFLNAKKLNLCYSLTFLRVWDSAKKISDKELKSYFYSLLKRIDILSVFIEMKLKSYHKYFLTCREIQSKPNRKFSFRSGISSFISGSLEMILLLSKNIFIFNT